MQAVREVPVIPEARAKVEAVTVVAMLNLAENLAVVVVARMVATVVAALVLAQV